MTTARGEVTIPVPGGHALVAALTIPDPVRSLVLFAHGGEDLRHSSRTLLLAETLHRRHHATLILDLVPNGVGEGDSWRFDVAMLSDQLAAVCDWVGQRKLGTFPLGLFGATAAAAAALAVSAQRPERVRAVVCRSGGLDADDSALKEVEAPVLLIVGGDDHPTIALNERVHDLLPRADLVHVEGASHLFAEPGALQHAADLAADWFDLHLHPRLA